MATPRQKREQLQRQQRKEQVASQMKKTRYEVLEQQDEARLNYLIEKTKCSITPHELYEVIGLANRNIANAVIHLGNLVIDQIVPAGLLVSIDWVFGNCDNWPWFIRVLAEYGVFTEQMFQHCCTRILTKRNSQSLEHSLEVLRQRLRENEAQTSQYLHRRNSLLVSILNFTKSAENKIATLAYDILAWISGSADETCRALIGMLGEKRISQIVLLGLLKQLTHLRVLSCQLANNVLLAGLPLNREILRRMMMIAPFEKPQVKLEISFYWLALAEQAPISQLAYCLDGDFLRLLQSYVQDESQNTTRRNSARACWKMSLRIRESYGQAGSSLAETMKIMGLLDVSVLLERMEDEKDESDKAERDSPEGYADKGEGYAQRSQASNRSTQ